MRCRPTTSSQQCQWSAFGQASTADLQVPARRPQRPQERRRAATGILGIGQPACVAPGRPGRPEQASVSLSAVLPSRATCSCASLPLSLLSLPPLRLLSQARIRTSAATRQAQNGHFPGMTSMPTAASKRLPGNENPGKTRQNSLFTTSLVSSTNQPLDSLKTVL